MPLVVGTDPHGNRIRYHDFKGKRFPPSALHDLDISLRNLLHLEARDGDVIIVSYPKAGCHWVWEICQMLMSGVGEVSTTLSNEDGLIDIQPTDVINSLPSRRVLSTHAPPELFSKDFVRKKTKVIFLLRNPKDIFVSFYHHVKNIKIYDYDGDWNSFYDHIMAGGVDYGDWFEFTKKWEKFLKYYRTMSVLKLYYEDLKQNCPAQVNKIAKFLGVENDPDFNKRIAAKCDFENMKKKREFSEEQSKFTKDGCNPMFRKGIVGEWKEYFTPAQNKAFAEEYKKHMAGLTFKFQEYL